jgi:hypothetical protein
MSGRHTNRSHRGTSEYLSSGPQSIIVGSSRLQGDGNHSEDPYENQGPFTSETGRDTVDEPFAFGFSTRHL